MEELCDCPDNTDWDISRTASNSLDKHTDAVTSYPPGFYNNNKPWFKAGSNLVQSRKERAFKSGDSDRFRLAIDWQSSGKEED